jgi:hypothetical protein
MKTITGFSLCLLVLSGCTKKEFQQIALKGDLSVRVTSLSEFGSYLKDNGNVELTIEGSTPEIKVSTDTSGSCLIKDLPMGTYNLIFSKEGFGTMKAQGFRFVGNEVPYKYSTMLFQKSSTKITSYTQSISGTTLTCSGTITHLYSKSALLNYPYNWPGLVIYISDSPNVSSTNYLNASYFITDQIDNTAFKVSLNVSSVSFPKGSTVYSIIYGRSSMGFSIYDVEKGVSYDPTLGEPSEVKTIVVP